MLRVIHNQTVAGGILIDDIDDGLPNKQVYRLGSTADPKAYERDGYANKSKQGCYVPFNRKTAGFPSLAGYVNLKQTDRILRSAGKGKISKLQTAGLVTVVSLTASQIVAPVVTAGNHSSSSNVALTGTTLTSVQPDVSTVTFAVGTAGSTPSPAVWTQSQITTAGGTISGTTISIPIASFTTAPVANNTVKVQANELTSNTFVLT